MLSKHPGGKPPRSDSCPTSPILALMPTFKSRGAERTGNCTSLEIVSKHFPAEGLFAHIDFVVPAGWPDTTAKTRGVNTVGTNSLTGMFVNNGPHLAGTLTMDPDIDPRKVALDFDFSCSRRKCDYMRELEYCRSFMPEEPEREAAQIAEARN